MLLKTCWPERRANVAELQVFMLGNCSSLKVSLGREAIISALAIRSQNVTVRSARRVVIKGTEDAEAVLCTKTATYAIKTVETTNSILLVPPTQARPPEG